MMIKIPFATFDGEVLAFFLRTAQALSLAGPTDSPAHIEDYLRRG